ncbi:MAG TPA: 16S rRNA (uracil(1498)-N(3))-methyltransferase [Streptosporangiaceae bacterium]
MAGAEGRHATTVRRLRPGEHVDITDGAGTMASCVVTTARPGVLELAVTGRVLEPAPVPRLTVVQALPKGDRGELAIETMTEVGVDVLVPWAAERSVAVWRGDKAARGAARWRSTALAAAKQARRSWLPEVTEVASTAEVAARVAAIVSEGQGLAVVLDPDAPQPLPAVAGAPGLTDIVLLVGPEGGISPAEAGVFAAAGAVGARLGPTVLRASSAGAIAAALVMTAAGRWD